MGLINFTAKLPKPFNQSAFNQAFGNSLERIVKGVKADFDKTTNSWSHKPDWTQETKVGPSIVSFKVVTTDQRYTWVNSGTATGRGGSSYVIRPRTAKALAYRENFKAKTTPGVLSSGGGGRTGAYVVRPFTIHPGMKARKFDIAVKKVWEPKFIAEMTAALSRFVSLSGHRI